MGHTASPNSWPSEEKLWDYCRRYSVFQRWPLLNFRVFTTGKIMFSALFRRNSVPFIEPGMSDWAGVLEVCTGHIKSCQHCQQNVTFCWLSPVLVTICRRWLRCQCGQDYKTVSSTKASKSTVTFCRYWPHFVASVDEPLQYRSEYLD